MAECALCGREYQLPTGRGGRSPYCETCKLERRAVQQQQRSLRHALTTVSEWIDALGPTIIGWKAEVVKQQDGKCARCAKAERLYLGRDKQGLVGLCQSCHDRWREERQTSERRGDHAGSDGDGVGASRGEPAGVA